jgi:tagaturonate reductase
MPGPPVPALNAAHWSDSIYPRAQLPERVLQFGTGMLLRAVCAAAVDSANRSGAFRGRIVVVQSTPQGAARAFTAQDGLFTLLERGVADGRPVDRARLVGSISRALVADAQWSAVRDVVSRPELQVIVSNVTEAGFRLAEGEPASPPQTHASPPTSFPAKLTDLLYTRFERLPDGPTLWVIPTELIPQNGPRLAAMVDQLAAYRERSAEFREWLGRRVRFCASLVDRITTGEPDPAARAELEPRLGYADRLLTVTEPYCFWAIGAGAGGAEPDALRAAFAIDGTAESVVFAPDIAFFEQRKLRLLNGAHTALAPLALLAGIPTVREAAEHPQLGPLLRHLLFREIVPGTDLPVADAEAFAHSVIDRFRNPWLDHPWRVIATNQTAKLRLRVVPSIAHFIAQRRHVPKGLALACAAYLRYVRPVASGGSGRGEAEGGTIGWWRGVTYPLVDADVSLIHAHWGAVEPAPAPGPVLAGVLTQLAARALSDRAVWGTSLSALPGFLEATTRWLLMVEHDGVAAAIDALHER